MKDNTPKITAGLAAAAPKPLLRGWFHALAAVGAVTVTVLLYRHCAYDPVRLVSALIFGFSMIALFTVSAVYHIGNWSGAPGRFLRSFDHANIFAVIAGTYTPFCFNVLEGWVGLALLLAIWLLAATGIVLAVFTRRVSRRVRTGLYIGMGWTGLLALPALVNTLPWEAIGLLLLGGLLYTAGGLVYGRRWPDPFPRVFGFHEIFHLLVIAGGVTYTASVWLWALPLPAG